MISLRYHIISISAVFLALAVGVVLGSTTLSRSLLSGLNNENEDLAAQVNNLQTEKNAQDARLADADSFAAAVGPKAVQGQLAQRTVVLVATADAKPADRDALKALVANAGGTVTGELQLTTSFSDPRHADQLKDIVVRLLPAGVQLPTASDPGTLAGGLLGPLMLINKDTNKPQASADETAAALSGLTEGGFVKASQGLQPAQLAIVLTGGAASGDGAGDRAATVARFATQVDRSGAGTVLAGDAGSASGTGPVGVVRADTAATSILSTVDNLQTSSGRVVTVLALVEQLEGKAGRYGDAGNAERPAPGSPTE
ncbi:MAG: copper transporter [Actinophytocola sp.]|uniref:copper transporter n=1 Tax=Actinophytocola sp. TaxID=1872138 RepID=UPI003C725F7E